MYLTKRITKIETYINNLIESMELKYDIDEFDQLKRFATYIDTLNNVSLLLPTDVLYHLVTGFEFDLIDLIGKIKENINIPQYEYLPQETGVQNEQ